MRMAIKMEWNGSTVGTQIVHRRIIKATFDDLQQVIDRETQEGLLVVKSLAPGAVYRAYCNCCYGMGPDISFWTTTDKDNNMVIEFSVNFDFEVEDDENAY